MAEKEFVWLQDPGTFPWIVQQRKPPIIGRPISVRDNYIRCATGEKPVWMPQYGYEANICWPDVIRECPVPERDGKDWWGTEWVNTEFTAGMMVKPYTRTISAFENWKEELKFPDLDSIDWAADAEKITSRFDPDRVHIFQCVKGMFERLNVIIPFEEALMGCMDDPELAQEFFQRMADYKIAICNKVIDNYGRIDGMVFHDDWGHQNGTFFSPDMFRELIFPATKRFIDTVKPRLKFVELHSCGRNISYVPMMLEMGIDMWCPQVVINDPVELKEKYGDKMTFVFPIPGLDSKGATEADIRRYVDEFVRFFGKGGRCMANFRLPKEMADREAIARDELYNFSLEFYKD